jgi:hypothetical protein
MKSLSIGALALVASQCHGFQTPSRVHDVAFTHHQRSRSSSSSQLNVVGPEHLTDLHSAFADSHAWTYLADAAQATLNPDDGNNLLGGAALQNAADVTEEIAKDGGWWAAYLNLFKTGLLTIHNTIDGPLRSNGITNTWGITIAIFTASKLYFFAFANIQPKYANTLI